MWIVHGCCIQSLNLSKHVIIDSISLDEDKFIFSTSTTSVVFNISHFFFSPQYLLQSLHANVGSRKSHHLFSADLAQTLPLLQTLPFCYRSMFHWDKSFNCHLVTWLAFSPQLLTWSISEVPSLSNVFI